MLVARDASCSSATAKQDTIARCPRRAPRGNRLVAMRWKLIEKASTAAPFRRRHVAVGAQVPAVLYRQEAARVVGEGRAARGGSRETAGRARNETRCDDERKWSGSPRSTAAAPTGARSGPPVDLGSGARPAARAASAECSTYEPFGQPPSASRTRFSASASDGTDNRQDRGMWGVRSRCQPTGG